MMSFPTDELTQAEKDRLNAIIIGYGKLRKASKKSGVPEQTLRRISLAGVGYTGYVKSIREKLFETSLNEVPE